VFLPIDPPHSLLYLIVVSPIDEDPTYKLLKGGLTIAKEEAKAALEEEKVRLANRPPIEVCRRALEILTEATKFANKMNLKVMVPKKRQTWIRALERTMEGDLAHLSVHPMSFVKKVILLFYVCSVAFIHHQIGFRKEVCFGAHLVFGR